MPSLLRNVRLCTCKLPQHYIICILKFSHTVIETQSLLKCFRLWFCDPKWVVYVMHPEGAVFLWTSPGLSITGKKSEKRKRRWSSMCGLGGSILPCDYPEICPKQVSEGTHWGETFYSCLNLSDPSGNCMSFSHICILANYIYGKNLSADNNDKSSTWLEDKLALSVF